jgi:hypothetical protein
MFSKDKRHFAQQVCRQRQQGVANIISQKVHCYTWLTITSKLANQITTETLLNEHLKQ